jgi:hypothetical protein
MAMDEDSSLVECFVNLPAQEGIPFVLDFQTIAAAQNRDADLMALAVSNPAHYVLEQFAPETQLLCHRRTPADNWKIVLPDELLMAAIRWYHLALSHIGERRLIDTMSMHFYHKRLRSSIEYLVSRCDTCQRQKLVGRVHGEAAPREAAILPWREIAVDTIGPWRLTVMGQELSFRALTIIDMVTNLTEIVRIPSKDSAQVALTFENTWLARYPRPSKCIYDQGGEFVGFPFQNVLRTHNIRRHPIASKNPQANAVCERMHQTIGNALRVLSTLNPPHGINDAEQLIDTAIANAMFAHRSSYHSSISTTPGGLAFGADMIVDLPLVADLELIRERRQQIIDRKLIEANRKRFSYDYAVGDEVLKLAYKPTKLAPRAISGPHPVERVHTNGTVTIRLSPTVTERISLRRIKPYRR